jgi:hypothetical protein
MKKLMMMIVAVLTIAACATPEERAARQAENLRIVKASVGSQRYRINVTSMRPMRGMENSVMGRWLKIDENTVDYSLPYVGRDDIPHMKTRGEMRMDARLEYRGEMQDYILQYQPKKKCGIITFKVNDGGEDYKFHITVDNMGTARIRVTPENRDYIDYEGDVNSL